MFLFDISETVINSFYTINTLNNVYDFYAVFFLLDSSQIPQLCSFVTYYKWFITPL